MDGQRGVRAVCRVNQCLVGHVIGHVIRTPGVPGRIYHVIRTPPCHLGIDLARPSGDLDIRTVHLHLCGRQNGPIGHTHGHVASGLCTESINKEQKKNTG